jgi:diamine N-acetyltransferase
VTKATVRRVCALRVAASQEYFVAPNAVSIAEAFFEHKAWFRAIYAGEEPVGFVMLYEDPAGEGGLPWDPPPGPVYFIWRFMIDEAHQGKGYGRRALELVIEHVRGLPDAKDLSLSVVPGDGSAERFYESLGFRSTGRIHEGEVEMRLDLRR